MMNKIIPAIFAVEIALSCCLANGVESSNGMYVKDRSVALNARLKNPPKLVSEGSFSIIVLGDPQSYSKFDFNQPVFELMTAWTAAKKRDLNIMTVLCTGDLVEQNGVLDSNAGTRYRDNNGNIPGAMQWKSVSHAFERLDGVYPYIAVTGNHDYGFEASENRNSEFPKIFNISRNGEMWRNHLVCTAPNAKGEHSLENAAYEFYDGNWGKILIIALEFSPRDEILEWAKNLCSKEQFSTYKVFVITHSLIEKNGDIRVRDNYPAAKNTGKDVLEKFLLKCPNVKFAVCGHTCDTNIMASFHTTTKENGQKLPIMMFNPQGISGFYGNGGDGWLRILEFKPDGKTISARTYSPLFGFSQRTESLAWNKSPSCEFDFKID